jgi:DNA polymerase-4
MVPAFLAPLPVGRLPGVGAVMEAKLARLGIATCADLRAIGGDALAERFGRWGRRLHELSLGIDERAVQPERPSLQVSAEDTFERDLPLDALGPHLHRLAAKAWAGYQRERERHPERVARTVVLKLKTSDFRVLTRSVTRAVPPPDEGAVADIASALRDRVQLPADTVFRLAGVGLAGFVDGDLAQAQRDMFGPGRSPTR